MPIRITGMYSGLDTEAIISELVSAQSVKKNKFVKEQTLLSWKMDAWKALNTKIYNFYTNTLDNMRFQAAYMKKATKVSNSNALSVVASNNAIDGVQTVTVDQLAKSGKLTGRDLSLDNPNVTGSTKLKDLGFDGDASFDVTVGGKTTTIKINGNTKISDVVSKLKNAGISASFDEANHRFFLSSTASGKDANFTITANDENGLKALDALGLVSKEDLANDEYKKWANYRTGTADDMGDISSDYQKLIDAEVAKRAKAYKKANDDLEAKNAALAEEIQKLKDDLSYEKDSEGNGISASDLYDKLYGTKADDSEERTGGLQQDLDAAKKALDEAQKALDEADEGISESEKAKLELAVTDAKAEVEKQQEAFNAAELSYKVAQGIEDRETQIATNEDTIAANKTYYDVTESEDGEGNTVENVSGNDKLKDEVTAEFDRKVKLAKEAVASVSEGGESLLADNRYATKVNGDDARITLDGAVFTSSTNDFTVNGLTISVYEKTDGPVTLTTSADVDGVYDMIKNFFTEYNSLINEMDALYNAPSAKGYDPLTSEEKAEMAESDIEEWEKKIKDSLLRRDGTLSDVTDAIKTIMMQGATVNGKTMYLSDFGINTLGYFNAGENEKGAYHIDGDPDDAATKGNDDILKSMIATDSDTVMKFFSALSNNLHDKLYEKMGAIKDTSSAFTVYNDKAMEKEYKAYTDKIAKEEDKLNALTDKWYSKFSQMETALAKLQSKNNGLTSMLGGGSN